MRESIKSIASPPNAGGIAPLPPCKFGPGCSFWIDWRKHIYINPGSLAEQPARIAFPYQGACSRPTAPAQGGSPRSTGSPRCSTTPAPPRPRSSPSPSPSASASEPAITASLRCSPRPSTAGFARSSCNRPSAASWPGASAAGGGAGPLPTLTTAQDLFAAEGDAPQALTVDLDDPSFSGYQAILSTTLRKIYLAGGTEGRRSNREIWSYDLEQQAWSEALPGVDNLPGGEVRSMALDPQRRWLYVLFRSDERWFELVRYDLTSKTSKRLVTWPDLKRSKAIYLNTLEDGTLVLTTSKENNHLAFAFDVKPNSFNLVGVIAGKDGIPYPPQLGAEGLVWPLVDTKDRLTLKAVTRASFKPGKPCDAL